VPIPLLPSPTRFRDGARRLYLRTQVPLCICLDSIPVRGSVRPELGWVRTSGYGVDGVSWLVGW
jgi:hypothetical protein